jgi:hypothetical protein
MTGGRTIHEPSLRGNGKRAESEASGGNARNLAGVPHARTGAIEHESSSGIRLFIKEETRPALDFIEQSDALWWDWENF